MATYTSVSLQQLIEDALDIIYRTNERPKPVSLATGISGASDKQLTLAGTDGAYVSPTMVLEFGQEKVLVQSSDNLATPTFTVSRGYSGTPAVAHTVGEVGLVDPQYGRRMIRDRIVRYVAGPLLRVFPYLVSTDLNTTKVNGVNQLYIPMPAEALDIMSVQYMSPTTGRIVDLGGWRFERNIPTSFVGTGKALRVPSSVYPTDDILITYSSLYTWSAGGSDPAESATVSLPLGGEDLPSLFAVAYVSSNRELTRQEVDRVEEWNQDMTDRRMINLQTIKQAWQMYYQRVDDVRRIQSEQVPRHKVFRRWPKPRY